MQLDEAARRNITGILKEAYGDGREMLYEHEVYGVLRHAGLDAPAFEFIEDPGKVDKNLLKKFGQDIIVKIVSPDIAHKQKLGGVKKIKNIDPLFVQFVLMKMKEEVISHFEEDRKPAIKGFLIVEYVSYSQSLGYEVLIGFKDDPAFGPVLTLSKGGDDAEFFARHFDPPNLFLPPFDMEQSLKLANSLNIRYKYQEIGHGEYTAYMAKAASALSQLAYHFSFIAPEKPEFVIKALDINPFVITEDGRFIALDGFAQFTPSKEGEKRVKVSNPHGLDKFFHPEGIAVIGVSSDMDKYSLGRDIAHLLHDIGRRDLYFVNAHGGSVRFGDTEYKLYRSLKEIHGRVDLLVYAAPAQYTIDFIREIPENGPEALILISGIPSSIKYQDFVRQVDEANRNKIRIIGPNCMGVFFAPGEGVKGLNTLFINEERLEIKYSDLSNAVLLTQSGALAVTAIDKLQRTRIFKSIVSFGNKCDVKITDLIAYFDAQEEIDVISLYIEGLDAGEGRQFFELAGKIKKPIIAYKSGKTEAGAKAAASHTASMSGSYDVFKAACAQSGVILVEDIMDHYNYSKIFSLLADRIPAGNRVAGVVNAGFESTVGADELKNLRQAKLGEDTVTKLGVINKHGLVDISSPFLDVTPMADDRMYADFVRAVLEDENVDCVFVAIVPHAVTLKTTPKDCYDSDSLANLLVGLSREYSKPMVVSVNAGAYYQEFVSIMEDKGLPVFTDIRSAINSLDTFVSYHLKKGGA